MAKWDWLNNPAAPSLLDLEVSEEEATQGDTILHRIVSRLVSRIRSLEHDLKDPNYLYAGSRIHRQAIVCRNAETDRLRQGLYKIAEYCAANNFDRQQHKELFSVLDAVLKREAKV